MKHGSSLTNRQGLSIIGVFGFILTVLGGLTVVLLPEAILLLLVALLALTGVVMCLLRPTWAVWLILGLLFFGDRSDIPQLLFWGRYLPTAGVVLFVCAISMQRVLTGNWRWKGRPLIVSYTLFAFLIFISALYNQTTARDLVLSLATNLRYPLFFIMLLNAELPLAFYQRVIKVFVILSLLQVPVTLVQFALGQKGDALTGTLGANSNLVAVIMISQFVLMAQWLRHGKRMWGYLAMIGALLIPCLLGDIQIVLLFFPLVAIFMLLRHYGLRRLRRLIQQSATLLFLSAFIVLIAFIAIPSINQFISLLPVHVQELMLTTPEGVVYTSAGRITIMRFALPMLFEDPLRVIWGFGPEATYGGLLTAVFSDRIASTITDPSSMGVVCRKLEEIGAICREPQSFRAVMDFGLLGSALYFFPQLLLWHTSLRLRVPLLTTEQYMVPLLFDGLCFFYIVLGVWYIGVWRLDSYSFMFWLTAAALFAERRASAVVSIRGASEGG